MGLASAEWMILKAPFIPPPSRNPRPIPPAPANSSTTFKVFEALRRGFLVLGPVSGSISLVGACVRASCLRASVMFVRAVMAEAAPEGRIPSPACRLRFLLRRAGPIHRECAINCTRSAIGKSTDDIPMIVPRWTPFSPPVWAAKSSPVPPGRTTDPSFAAPYLVTLPSGIVASTSSHGHSPSMSRTVIRAPFRCVGVTVPPGRTSRTKGSSKSHSIARQAALSPYAVPPTTTDSALPVLACSSNLARALTRRWGLRREASDRYDLRAIVFATVPLI